MTRPAAASTDSAISEVDDVPEQMRVRREKRAQALSVTRGPGVTKDGLNAALRERDRGAPQRLVTLVVDSIDAEAGTFDPIWSGERRVGFVTSGGYGHRLGKSLALG